MRFVLLCRNLPKEVIKPKLHETLKTRLGKTFLHVRRGGRPTPSGGSGQDNLTAGLGTTVLAKSLVKSLFIAAVLEETP